MEFYIVVRLPIKILKFFSKNFFVCQIIIFVKTFEYKMLFPFFMDSIKFYTCLLTCQYFKFVLLFKPLYTIFLVAQNFMFEPRLKLLVTIKCTLF
jgi:hypothetical protein